MRAVGVREFRDHATSMMGVGRDAGDRATRRAHRVLRADLGQGPAGRARGPRSARRGRRRHPRRSRDRRGRARRRDIVRSPRAGGDAPRRRHQRACRRAAPRARAGSGWATSGSSCSSPSRCGERPRSSCRAASLRSSGGGASTLRSVPSWLERWPGAVEANVAVIDTAVYAAVEDEARARSLRDPARLAGRRLCPRRLGRHLDERQRLPRHRGADLDDREPHSPGWRARTPMAIDVPSRPRGDASAPRRRADGGPTPRDPRSPRTGPPRRDRTPAGSSRAGPASRTATSACRRRRPGRRSPMPPRTSNVSLVGSRLRSPHTTATSPRRTVVRTRSASRSAWAWRVGALRLPGRSRRPWRCVTVTSPAPRGVPSPFAADADAATRFTAWASRGRPDVGHTSWSAYAPCDEGRVRCPTTRRRRDEQGRAEVLAVHGPVLDADRPAVAGEEDCLVPRQQRPHVVEQVRPLGQRTVGVDEAVQPPSPGVRVTSCRHSTSAPHAGNQSARAGYLAPPQAFSEMMRTFGTSRWWVTECGVRRGARAAGFRPARRPHAVSAAGGGGRRSRPRGRGTAVTAQLGAPATGPNGTSTTSATRPGRLDITHHALGQVDGLAHVVGHHQHGRRRCAATPGAGTRAGSAGSEVEGAERLVEQQHVGLGDERPGDRHPLAHAARQLAGQAVGELGQAHDAQHLGDPRGAARPAAAEALQAEGHVLGHGPPREQRVGLEHHAPVGPGPDHQVAVDRAPCPPWAAPARRRC